MDARGLKVTGNDRLLITSSKERPDGMLPSDSVGSLLVKSIQRSRGLILLALSTYRAQSEELMGPLDFM